MKNMVSAKLQICRDFQFMESTYRNVTLYIMYIYINIKYIL